MCKEITKVERHKLRFLVIRRVVTKKENLNKSLKEITFKNDTNFR